MKRRYLHSEIQNILKSRMLFLGGPRQVGKTSLALQFLDPQNSQNPAYLNWDIVKSRSLLRQGLLPSSPIVVLDEIHKYKLWRSLVKGFYDGNKGQQNYIVTGSARLDYYRRGGDSLLGRYRYLRLHPFSLAEINSTSSGDLKDLLQFGGFPEPFLSQDHKNHRLWCQERLYRIVNDDISTLEGLKDFSRLENLAEAIVPRVGSLFSYRSLEEDLQVSQKTIVHWIDILERLYYVYRVFPFAGSKLRAIKKAPKIYLWDWSEIPEPGPRFENFVGSQLLKFCHFKEDTEGEKYELRYFRDVDHREVDFVVVKGKQAVFAIECKTGDREASRSALYLQNKFPKLKIYQTHTGTKDLRHTSGLRIIPFPKLSQELGLV